MYKLEITFASLAELSAFVQAAQGKQKRKTLTVLPPVKNPGHSNGQRWTSAEDTYIRDHYAEQNADQIAKHLGCSTASVYSRAKKLDATSKRGTNTRSINALRKLGKISLRSDGVYIEHR